MSSPMFLIRHRTCKNVIQRKITLRPGSGVVVISGTSFQVMQTQNLNNQYEYQMI